MALCPQPWATVRARGRYCIPALHCWLCLRNNSPGHPSCPGTAAWSQHHRQQGLPGQVPKRCAAPLKPPSMPAWGLGQQSVFQALAQTPLWAQVQHGDSILHPWQSPVPAAREAAWHRRPGSSLSDRGWRCGAGLTHAVWADRQDPGMGRSTRSSLPALPPSVPQPRPEHPIATGAARPSVLQHCLPGKQRDGVISKADRQDWSARTEHPCSWSG